MRRISWRKMLLLAPAPALLALAIGCGGGESKPAGGGDTGGGGAAVAPVKKEKAELASTGWGTLKGKVTLDGPKPEGEIKKDNESLHAQMEKHQDKDRCLSDKAPESDKEEQAWRIDKDGGVQNVVVWLRPPDANHYFKIDTDNASWEKDVKIDQPYCAFEPHVVTLFPSYYDAKTKKSKETGQKFQIDNSAPMNHNTKWSGGPKNPGSNVTLPPKDKRDVSLEPSYSEPVAFACNIHPWMNAYAWVFDHPYAAVTKEDGTYEIKHVPTGVDLQVVAWHEKGGWLNGDAKGETMKLKDGDNTKDFKVKVK